MTISTKFIVQEAERLGIIWKAIPGTRIIELTLHNHLEYFTAQISGHTSALAYLIANNKDATKSMLERCGVETPRGAIFTRKSALAYQKKLFERLVKPLVVKPRDGAHGMEVYLHITSLSDMQKKLKRVLSKYSSAIVEEMKEGEEYRIVLTREKVIAVTRRIPANVVGNGKQSIKQLVDEKNKDPRRGDSFLNHALLKIKLNKTSYTLIKKQGFASIDDIPTKGQQVFLRETSNMSTGGDSIDVTDLVHESVKTIALQAINAIPGLAFAGLDFITIDITKPQTESTYTVLEINKSPGIFFQYMPYLGKSRPAPREFLRVLFPELKG